MLPPSIIIAGVRFSPDARHVYIRYWLEGAAQPPDFKSLRVFNATNGAEE
jgi:hypothetical protein